MGQSFPVRQMVQIALVVSVSIVQPVGLPNAGRGPHALRYAQPDASRVVASLRLYRCSDVMPRE